MTSVNSRKSKGRERTGVNLKDGSEVAEALEDGGWGSVLEAGIPELPNGSHKDLGVGHVLQLKGGKIKLKVL